MIGFRPESFIALRVLISAKSYIQKMNCDHTDPTDIHTPPQDLVAIVSVQEELNQTQMKTLTGENNVRRYNMELMLLRAQMRMLSHSCKRSLWVARKSVFLTVPSVVLRIPATVLSFKP